VKTASLDDRRRLVMPPECPPNSAVTIQQVDNHTWIVRRALPAGDIKLVMIPIIKTLPADPEWDKVETAFARAASAKLPAPED
jgi:hypothetical protein